MATVNMDLAEVDSFRQTIKDQNKEIDSLKSELYEVKADKRVLVITKQPIKAFNGPPPYTINRSEIEGLLGDFQRSLDTQKRFGGSYSTTIQYFINGLSKAIQFPDVELQGYGVGMPRDGKETKTFMGFDDVYQQLREEIEQGFKDKINALQVDKDYYDANILRTQKQCVADITNLKEEHRNYVQKLQDDHKNSYEYLQNQYNELVVKYRELETGKKEQTRIEELTEQVNQLTAELEKERKKTVLSKLFS